MSSATVMAPGGNMLFGGNLSRNVATRPATSAMFPELEYTQGNFEKEFPELISYKNSPEPSVRAVYNDTYAHWKKQKIETITGAQNATANISAGVRAGAQAGAEKANVNGAAAALLAQQKAAKEAAGQQYTDDLGLILAGQYNYRTATDNQQAVVQQAALGGWTGASGALAGQQKASQLGATDVLQDRAAQAQDIFATNSAIAQRTQQALAQEFSYNEQSFNTQLGYSQQFLENANAMLATATGEQKLALQGAINKYENLLSQYQNSYQQDKLDDSQKWTLIKAIAGAGVALASAIAAPSTAGATTPGIAAGIGLATS